MTPWRPEHEDVIAVLVDANTETKRIDGSVLPQVRHSFFELITALEFGYRNVGRTAQCIVCDAISIDVSYSHKGSPATNA